MRGCAILIRSALADRDAFRPNGAPECSHGWSAARRPVGEAQPVETDVVFLPCPVGAGEAHDGSIEHILLVELDFVQPEHAEQLGLEVFFLVMVVLRCDVRLDRALL